MHGNLLSSKKRAVNSRTGAGTNKMLKLTSIVPNESSVERKDMILEAEAHLLNLFER